MLRILKKIIDSHFQELNGGNNLTMRHSPPRTSVFGLSAVPVKKRIVSVLSILIIVLCVSCIVLYTLDSSFVVWRDPEHGGRRHSMFQSSQGIHSSWLRPNHSSQCQVHTLLENFHNYEDFESFYACQRIMYNRVPKCASRTVLSTFKLIANAKFFNLVSDPQKMTLFYLNERQEQEFVHNVSSKPEPLVYTRHILYVNFTRYNTTPPVYINVIRDPLERVVSHFYYNKYGDNNKINFNSSMPNMTLDECLENPCGFKMDRLLPFFCGSSKPCRRNNDNLLAIAKKHVKQNFLVVGLMEDLPSFMEVLETLMPHFFTNARSVLETINSAKKQQYKTVHKYPIRPDTEEKLRKILQKEYEFYNFVRQRFYNLLQRVRSVKHKLYKIKVS